MNYYAHTIPGREEQYWHSLRDHLLDTGKLAAKFAAKFGAKEFGLIAGLLHDIGKYSIEFQERLRGSPVPVDHSTAGAKEAISLYGKAVGQVLAYVIAGHHTGLPDYGSPVSDGSLAARLHKPTPDCNVYVDEIGPVLPKNIPSMPPMKSNREIAGFTLQFFIRMLFSCLVDADFLDTESALNPPQFATRQPVTSIFKLKSRLDRYLKKFDNSEPTHVNQLRAEILAHSRRAASQAPGLFTLTVPTGGGKTLSSLAFALNHAVQYNLERIIYVVPFTSIIEQNAAEFRRALGDDAVLEHHSNFPLKTDEEESLDDYRLRLAQENWDVPVVVTTNVQFFESLFSHRGGRCRKLHNIAHSVVVLDEAQMLPTPYLRPCLWVLNELIQNYNVSVVLCTATQPTIHGMLPTPSPVREIAPDPKRLYEELRRVRVNWLGEVDDGSLAADLSQHRQVLCIVNTRTHAALLYEGIRGQGTYHLSARMYPAHRSRKLDDIRAALKRGEECRVVSTQLIEAGVDIDFPVVYRALSGVDSIAQAAGRCNREGRLPTGDVNVFRPESRHIPRGWFQRTAAITEMVLRDHQDLLSLDAVEQYFNLLYEFEGDDLDSKRVIKRLNEGAGQLAFPFRQIGEDFQLIDSPMTPVIIPRDRECKAVLDEARFKGASLTTTRQLQPYVVQIYAHELMELSRSGALEMVAEQYTVLRDLSFYDEDVGLTITDTSYVDEVLIF